MSNVTFNNNYLTAKANASVEFLDFGFSGAEKVVNNQTTPTAVSGKSQKVVAHYTGGHPPPKAFSISQEAKFPVDAHVTITGGGPADNVVEAIDTLGNRGVWIVVGVGASN